MPPTDSDSFSSSESSEDSFESIPIRPLQRNNWSAATSKLLSSMPSHKAGESKSLSRCLTVFLCASLSCRYICLCSWTQGYIQAFLCEPGAHLGPANVRPGPLSLPVPPKGSRILPFRQKFRLKVQIKDTNCFLHPGVKGEKRRL